MSQTRTAAIPNERRTYQRKEVNYKATVRLADGNALDCTVQNVSPMGALIIFDQARILPRQFRLSIPSELFVADCEFRHQTTNTVGVLFTSNRMEALARFG